MSDRPKTIRDDTSNADIVVGPDGKALKVSLTPGKLPAFLRGSIKDWWFEKGDYKEIQDILAASGYFVPKETLLIWCDQKWPDATPAVEPFDPEIQALTPQQQAIHLLWAKAVTAIRGISSHRAYAVNNIMNMASAVQRIATAQSIMEKIEQDKLKMGGDTQKIIEAAKEQLMAEARKVLEQRPDLLQHVEMVCSVFESAEENIRLLQ